VAANKTILLAAGGTGGHLFPAQALASELGRRGWTVDLATDERADHYGQDFPARQMYILSAATITGRSPMALIRTAFRLTRGMFQAMSALRKSRPAAVVGFGGYPTLPPLMAARLMGIPTILHEANSVMGRANRFLAKRVAAIATSFPDVKYLEAAPSKVVMTGNPVRDAVVTAASKPYAYSSTDDLNVLVFGGSQGARVFSEVVPAAFQILDEPRRGQIRLVQQCRPEDMARVQAIYDDIGLTCELAPFFSDLADRIADSDLVICRSGASTVSELAVIGRPSMLIPLPHAIDQDQKMNAAILAEAEGAVVIAQDDFTPDRLARDLATFMDHPERLVAMAAKAKTIGRADAVTRLADLAISVATGAPAITHQGEAA